MESIKKAQQIHKQNAEIRKAKRAIVLANYNKKQNKKNRTRRGIFKQS